MTAFTNREVATVLAALRAFQKNPDRGAGEHFRRWTPLTFNQINALCERINLGRGRESAAVANLIRAAQAVCQSVDGTDPAATREQHAADLKALADAISRVQNEKAS